MNLKRIPLPAPDPVVADLRERGDSLAGVAGCGTDEVLAALRDRLFFPRHPHLQVLAEMLLGLPLKHLTVLAAPGWKGVHAFLTFDSPGFEVHLPGIRRWPPGLRESFPFERIDGLVGFMTHFGGLIHGEIPPGACFVRPETSSFIHENDPLSDWGGPTRNWEGSLPWY